MRKLKLFFACLLMAVLSIGQMWADDVTFNYSDYKGNGTQSYGSEYTMSDKADVSIKNTKFYGNNSYAHFYANGTTTITPAANVTITGITLTASATNNNGFQSNGTVTASTGTVSGSSTSTTVTWSGSASSAFTISNNKQIRWTSIVVTYTKGGGNNPGTDPGEDPGEDPDPTDDADVTLDLTSNTAWGFPVGSSNKTVAEGSYSDGTYTIKVAGSTGQGYYYHTSGYLLLGKTGAYIELPAFASPVEKIALVGTSGGSEGVTYNVFDGDTKVKTTDAVGCKNVTAEFEIANPTANKVYTIKVTGNANLQLSAIKIYYVAAADVAAPSVTASGKFVDAKEVSMSCSTEGATIYYTTNGSTPTSASTPYTAAFNVEETTTIKAIAILGASSSAVTERVYTKVTPLTTMAQVHSAMPEEGNATIDVTITDWIVTGAKNEQSQVWFTNADNTKGILLYKSDHGFVAGKKINGTVFDATITKFNGGPELTTLTASQFTVTDAPEITPAVVTIADLNTNFPADQGRVVKLENVTYNGSAFSDGNNTITIDTRFYNPTTLVNGTPYNLSGVVFYGNNVIKIMPRSADDVVAKSAVSIPTAANLAALKAADRGTYILTLSNAVVSYVNGNNAFIEDATGGALIYIQDHEFNAGDCLNGDYQVTTVDYQGKFEITAIEPQTGAVTTTADIPLTTVSIATLNANFSSYESRRVKIVGANVTDAISGSDRNGVINDGAAVAVYAAAGTGKITLTANDNVDVIGYPGYHNTDQQLNVWKQEDITVNEKVTVRFFAPSSWENVYVNTWDGTDNGQHAMTAVGEGNWYQCKIEKGAPFLFYNGSWNGTNQTVDIAALTEDKCFMGTLPETEGGKISVAEVANCAATYFIAGSENLTGQDWQHIALNEGNAITFNNVAAGDHQFKITNGTWYWSIGLANASATGVTLWNGGDNVGFTTTAAMNITITYNPATNTITVAAEAVSDDVEWSTIKYYSNGSLFETKENIQQGQPYTVALENNPWRPGYNFAGWSASEIASASEFTTPLTTITPDADEVTLYAVFSREITPGSTTYNKVTSAPADWSGEYLLVYEDAGTAYVWNGADAANCHVDATINADAIAKPAGAAELNIAAVTGGYTIAINGGENDGKYFQDNANNAAFKFSTADGAATVTISYEENWTKILFSQRCIRFNNGTNSGMRFRNYAATNQQPVQLYKKVATPGTYSYTTDPATIYHIAGTPALTGEGTAEAWAHVALGEGNTITFDNVEAGEYKFKITDGTWDWSKGDAAVDKTNSSGVTFSETDGDGNVVFSVASENSVTITYDAANEKILVVAPIVRDYHIAGSEALTGQDWQHIALNEGNSITFNNVAAGDYEFKITDGTWNWYVSYAAENVDSENSNVTISESESNNNFKFTLAAKSNVTIAYNEETGKVTVNAEAIPEPKNVVILAVYNEKYYAMSTTNANNGFTAIAVEYDGSQITVKSEAEKTAIQWTRTTNGDNTTFQDADSKYMKSADGASMSLDANVCNWLWDATGGYYKISGTSRTFFFQNTSGGIFKNYAVSNFDKTGYSNKAQVIVIDPENIVITAKVSAELAYDPASDEITQGDAWTAPALVNPHSVTITSYASDNEAVATVDGGVIALAGGIGTAHITAHFDGDASYLEGDAVYTITVNAPAPVVTGTTYRKVTSTEDITNGDYLIVYEATSVAFNGALENLDVEGNSIAVTINEGVISGTTAIDAAVFTIDKTAGTLKSASGKYIGVSSNSNGLKQTEDASTYTHTFSIDDDGAVILANFEGSTMKLRYNPSTNAGNLRFRYYKNDGQQAIQLYKRDAYTRTVTEGRYGTICLPRAGKMVGASIYEIAYFGQTSNKVFFDEIVNGEMVAGMPYVFLPNENVTELKVVYTSTTEAEEAQSNNGLHGTLSAMTNILASYNIYLVYQNQILHSTVDGSTLAANRAYIKLGDIDLQEPALAPGRRRVSMGVQGEQVATAIDGLNATEVPVKVLINGQLFILRGEKMYNVNGQVVK